MASFAYINGGYLTSCVRSFRKVRIELGELVEVKEE